MAYFDTGRYECKCGGDTFEEIKLVVLKSECKALKKGKDTPIPGRLLESENVAYKCTRCGAIHEF